jgi:peroxiredoxin
MPVAMPKVGFGKALEILLWLAALGVLAENVVLLRKNRQLREALPPQITVGTRLQMLSGLALDGRVEPVTLPSASSKLLIITFSPGCPACQANQEGWMRLASALKQRGTRVLWVSRDSIEITAEYCMKQDIPVSDTVADPPFKTYLQLGMALVPNTVLVGSDGRVEKVWAGRLDQGGWNSLFAYFGERQETASPLRSQVGTNPAGCGSGLSQASAKSCK